MCYTGLTWAAGRFAADVRAFDIESLLWAGAAGLLGGAFRTILTLAGGKRVVYDLGAEAVKDMAVALIAGLAAYFVVEGISSVLVTYLGMGAVPRDMRMLIILGAGWSRMGFFGRLDKFTTRVLARVETKIQGTDTGPSSEAMPLEK